MGDKMGRVHVKQQDIKTLQIRKHKKLIKREKMEKDGIPLPVKKVKTE